MIVRPLVALVTVLGLIVSSPVRAENESEDSFVGLLAKLKEENAQAPNADTLERYIKLYEEYYRQMDAVELGMSLAPSMLAQLATDEGVSPEEWRSAAVREGTVVASMVEVDSFRIDRKDIEIVADANDRHFAVLSACAITTFPPHVVVRGTYVIVAVHENSRWYMVPIDEAAQVGRVKRLYPVLANAEFKLPVFLKKQLENGEIPSTLPQCTLFGA